MIETNVARAEVAEHLPRHSRWMLGSTSLDFEFLNSHSDFRALTDSDVVGGPLPKEWTNHLVFGYYSFANGGGATPWIAVHLEQGSVWALDIERESETRTCFSSSLQLFIRTFLLLHEHFRESRTLTDEFLQQLQELDPHIFPSSTWREFLELSSTA